MPKKQDNLSVKKKENRTTITFNTSPENKKALKIYCVEKDITISALINKWIEDNCKGAK